MKTYDAALQLHANDADAKYNRDLVKRKLEELKKKQEQQQKQQQQNQQSQKQDQKDKDQQTQSGQDQKPDQQNQSGQNSDAKKGKPKTKSRTNRINRVKTPRPRTTKTKTRNPARIPSPANRRISNKRTAVRNRTSKSSLINSSSPSLPTASRKATLKPRPVWIRTRTLPRRPPLTRSASPAR